MPEIYKQIATVLLVIGGITLGLFGLFNFNLLTGIFGNLLGRLICIVIGVGAGYLCYLFYLEKFKKPPQSSNP